MSKPVSINGSVFQCMIGATAVIINTTSSQKPILTNCMFFDCKNYQGDNTSAIRVIKGKTEISNSCFKSCSSYQYSIIRIGDESQLKYISLLYCTDVADDITSFDSNDGTKLIQSNYSSNDAASSSFIQIWVCPSTLLSYSLSVNNSGKYSVQVYDKANIELNNLLIAKERISVQNIYFGTSSGTLKLKSVIFSDSTNIPIFKGTPSTVKVTFEDCLSYGQEVGIANAGGITVVGGEVEGTLYGCGTLMNGCNYNKTEQKDLGGNRIIKHVVGMCFTSML